MNIAYLISQYPASSCTFIRREIEELRRRGLDIQTFSVRQPLPEERIAEVDRREFENTWYILPAKPLTVLWSHAISFILSPSSYFKTLALAFRHRESGIRALFYALFYFTEAIILANELRRRNVKHIHNHFAQAGAIVGLLASRYLGIEWSLTLHGLCDFEGTAGRLLNQKVAAARFVACISHFGRAQAMLLVKPNYWPKLFISRCGLNLETLPAPSIEKHSRLRVLCVARLSPEKGLIGLIDGFAKAVKQGANLELRLIGEGPERDNIEKRIIEQGEGVQERIILLGRAPEAVVYKELACSDIFVISSFMEGLPVVLMEALACRVPVIAPCVSGIPELVVSEKTGLLFSPANWDELAEQLVRLSRDSELRIRLAAEGQRRVQAEFDIRRAVEPLLSKLSVNS